MLILSELFSQNQEKRVRGKLDKFCPSIKLYKDVLTIPNQHFGGSEMKIQNLRAECTFARQDLCPLVQRAPNKPPESTSTTPQYQSTLSTQQSMIIPSESTTSSPEVMTYISSTEDVNTKIRKYLSSTKFIVHLSVICFIVLIVAFILKNSKLFSKWKESFSGTNHQEIEINMS
ncbi:hypothetical protein RF11_07711 [Thelohanellus kitauei]|uniref:Uncharacterized protein n=1 Tax=Thelohanellus kitauei TaxID=669202 RepID=A0A0C2JDL8_THEKT|nr:hypothetical protein RF11_07711 [Thelohanellus kitauei]